MISILVLIVFILNGYVSTEHAGVRSTITCGYGRSKVTGLGDACCTLLASGVVGNEAPYDSKTQVCCRGNTYYSGGSPIFSSKIHNATACCLEEGYDKKTQKCCTAYDEGVRLWRYGSVGYGDSCCGPKVYNYTTHGCCHTFVVGRTLYDTYDLVKGCCINGVVSDGAECLRASNNNKNSAPLGNLKTVYLTFTVSLLFKVGSFFIF